MASISLPRDIIVDILCRLTVKDLLRYRPVCRQWRFLIDSPDFIRMHLHHHHHHSNRVILAGDSDLLWVDDLCELKSATRLANPTDGGCAGAMTTTQVLGSCNGLLALKENSENSIFSENNVFALWNPSTRRLWRLPTFNIEVPPTQRSASNFFTVTFGFGHDPSTDDYKLLWMAQFHDLKHDAHSFHSTVMVYSAKSNTWKSIDPDFPNTYCLIPFWYKGGHGVLSGNALHWLVSQKVRRTNDSKSKSRTIMSFDLVTEKYREVVLPDYEEENKTRSCVIITVDVIGGSLCVILNDLSDHVEVWVMKEYGVSESWTKLLSLVPYEVLDTSLIGHVSLVAASKKNGRDGVILKLNNRLIWYDLERKMAEKMWIVSGADNRPLKAYRCVGSLVGLKNTTPGELSWKQVEEDGKKGDNDHITHKRLSFQEAAVSSPLFPIVTNKRGQCQGI